MKRKIELEQLEDDIKFWKWKIKIKNVHKIL